MVAGRRGNAELAMVSQRYLPGWVSSTPDYPTNV